MRLTLAELEGFHASAASPFPLLILGAGRWGRLLAGVAAQARGGIHNLALVARSTFDDALAWSRAQPELAGLAVRDRLSDALETLDGAPRAIVASRPRDHRADTLACLDLGLDTLVEKPLATTAGEAQDMLAAADGAHRRLSLGVEFSLMPAFHYLAEALDEPVVSIDLDWTDPPGETRHGLAKRTHDEIDVLQDVLPHALSVLRIFAPDAPPRLEDATLGALRFGQARLRVGETTMVLRADQAAPGRTRRLLVRTAGGRTARVDFAGRHPEIECDGLPLATPSAFSRMDSVLRLEIGALAQGASPLSHRLEDFAALVGALEAPSPRWSATGDMVVGRPVSEGA